MRMISSWTVIRATVSEGTMLMTISELHVNLKRNESLRNDIGSFYLDQLKGSHSQFPKV